MRGVRNCDEYLPEKVASWRVAQLGSSGVGRTADPEMENDIMWHMLPPEFRVRVLRVPVVEMMYWRARLLPPLPAGTNQQERALRLLAENMREICRRT